MSISPARVRRRICRATETLKKGQDVTIAGSGKFSGIKHSARTGRNRPVRRVGAPYPELGVGTIVILPLTEQPVTLIARVGTDVPASQVSDDPRQLPSSCAPSYTTVLRLELTKGPSSAQVNRFASHGGETGR